MVKESSIYNSYDSANNNKGAAAIDDRYAQQSLDLNNDSGIDYTDKIELSTQAIQSIDDKESRLTDKKENGFISALAGYISNPASSIVEVLKTVNKALNLPIQGVVSKLHAGIEVDSNGNVGYNVGASDRGLYGEIRGDFEGEYSARAGYDDRYDEY